MNQVPFFFILGALTLWVTSYRTYERSNKGEAYWIFPALVGVLLALQAVHFWGVGDRIL